MQIDVRGLECPTPLIRVKEFLESPNGNESFTVIFSANINGNASFQNVSRFLKKYNREFKKIESDDKITMEVSASTGEIAKIEEKVENYCDISNKSVVAIVKSDVIGSDEKELGRILMHSFLKTLPSVTDEFTIKKAVFLNKGVTLACEGSEFVKALQELESCGFELFVCGTCLDYFNLKSNIKVGNISNMMEIINTIKESDKTICLT